MQDLKLLNEILLKPSNTMRQSLDAAAGCCGKCDSGTCKTPPLA